MNDIGADRTADIRILRKFYRDGLLSNDAFIAASGVLRPASAWFSWARRMLLFWGSAMVLAGIIFFFAYNWKEMGKFFKFGVIEAGIAGCIIASHIRRDRLSGKVLLLSGSVLVGVLLAVYGQIYQTGADAFELFTGWAILIFGWVIVSEFAALWLIWLILLNIGAILYWQQVGHPAHSIRYEFLCFGTAILDGTALVLRELCVRRGIGWLNGSWLRGILLAALLAALTIPTIRLIVDFEKAEGVGVFAAFAWTTAAVGGYACYRFKIPDIIALSLIVMNACILLLTLIGKIMFHNSGYNDAVPFLLFALIILGVVSGSAFWLRTTAETMSKESAK